MDSALILNNIKTITLAQAEQATAASAVQAAHKRAKTAGINLEAMKLVLRLRKMDPNDAATVLAATVAYLEATGSEIVRQADMFVKESGDTTTSLADRHDFRLHEIEIEGRHAGLKGYAKQAPAAEGSEEAQRWYAGYGKGAAARPKDAARRDAPPEKVKPRRKSAVVTAPKEERVRRRGRPVKQLEAPEMH